MLFDTFDDLAVNLNDLGEKKEEEEAEEDEEEFCDNGETEDNVEEESLLSNDNREPVEGLDDPAQLAEGALLKKDSLEDKYDQGVLREVTVERVAIISFEHAKILLSEEHNPVASGDQGMRPEKKAFLRQRYAVLFNHWLTFLLDSLISLLPGCGPSRRSCGLFIIKKSPIIFCRHINH